MSNWSNILDLEDAVNKFNDHYKKYFPCGIELSETVVHIRSVDDNMLTSPFPRRSSPFDFLK